MTAPHTRRVHGVVWTWRPLKGMGKRGAWLDEWTAAIALDVAIAVTETAGGEHVPTVRFRDGVEATDRPSRSERTALQRAVVLARRLVALRALEAALADVDVGHAVILALERAQDAALDASDPRAHTALAATQEAVEALWRAQSGRP